MSAFRLVGGELHAERVPLAAVAERFGTPCFVYSRAAIESGYREFDAAFAGQPHLVCYAVKANSNLAVLNLLARAGCGFDIVSGGERGRVLAAGGDGEGRRKAPPSLPASHEGRDGGHRVPPFVNASGCTSCPTAMPSA